MQIIPTSPVKPAFPILNKKQRNRISARKCRAAKKRKIEQLEKDVTFLSNENARLQKENAKLEALIKANNVNECSTDTTLFCFDNFDELF